jgi:hypothetical protein
VGAIAAANTIVELNLAAAWTSVPALRPLQSREGKLRVRETLFYPFQKEVLMYRVSGISIMVAGLCLMLGAVPSWAGPPNNDVSDARGNTAGGTGALVNNSTGAANTAFGDVALQNNTDGW